jgi:hypothetical protein
MEKYNKKIYFISVVQEGNISWQFSSITFLVHFQLHKYLKICYWSFQNYSKLVFWFRNYKTLYNLPWTMSFKLTMIFTKNIFHHSPSFIFFCFQLSNITFLYYRVLEMALQFKIDIMKSYSVKLTMTRRIDCRVSFPSVHQMSL